MAALEDRREARGKEWAGIILMENHVEMKNVLLFKFKDEHLKETALTSNI